MVVIVAIGLVISAWKGRPELLEVYPVPGAENVQATTPIRLVFSRPMQAGSVTERLKIEPAVEGAFSWDKNTLTFIPHHAWPGGGEISLRLEAGAKAASWLAFPMRRQTWTFTTSQAYLAYLWPTDGPADIYALNPSTGEILQYTHEMGVLEYAVGKDGTMIYFSTSNSKGGSDLYAFDRMEAAALPDQYKPEKLLDCDLAQCRSPVVSDDGKYLAYEYIKATIESVSPAQIWLISLSSLATSQVGQAMHETVQPAWSSSGWLAYYDRTSSQYEVFNPLTQARIQLPNQTGQPGSWNADGSVYLAPEITYRQTAGSTETATSHLLQYYIQTGSSKDISIADEVEDVEGTYSPDGGLIAFTRKFLDKARWTLGRQVWVMSSDGSNPHPITDAPDYNHYDLAWSQDGLKVAYVRFNQAKLSEPPELWIVNMDGSDPLELVVGGYSPVWIP